MAGQGISRNSVPMQKMNPQSQSFVPGKQQQPTTPQYFSYQVSQQKQESVQPFSEVLSTEQLKTSEDSSRASEKQQQPMGTVETVSSANSSLEEQKEEPKFALKSKKSFEEDRKAGDRQVKHAFCMDLKAIARGEDSRTTVMIKNIPNKYTQKMLLQKINETHKGQYDFFYLPIDFKNQCNVGYAFINFMHPACILEFHQELDGKKWQRFNSEKVCQITYGRLQGKKALIEHFDSIANQQQGP